MKRSVLLVVLCVLFSLWLGLGAILNGKGPEVRGVLIVADQAGPMEVLAKGLLEKGAFQVKYVEQGEMESDLSGYYAVFMYIHNKMEAATERFLIDYAEGGGRLVVLHHGLASARVNNPAWLEMAGIYLAPRNDKDRPWQVVAETTHTIVNLRPGHYITSHEVEYDGEVEYQPSDYPSAAGKYLAIELADTEVFLNQQFTDGRQKTVLLGFRCLDPETKEVYMQDRGGWYKKVGDGWLFYLQAGHKASDFENAAFMQIILNTLSWKP